MCGINGIFGLNDGPRKEAIARMNQNLVHRGPDAQDIYHDQNISLGHTRLKIIDLSDTANQPMKCFQSRYVLVFNGEIYNFKSLKAQFSDYPYQTQSDSEVILAAWHAKGAEAISLLEGQFAFAIWDHQEQVLHLVRDRLGIKPLYYYHNSDVLVFSSEIRPILKTQLFKPVIKPDALIDYMRYQTVHGPETIIGQIKQLMPGYYFKVGFDEATLFQYWDARYDYDELGYHRSKEEAQKKVRELLTQAVEKRLIADVPFGAFLSGGIDSSLIVGIMAEVMDQKVKTFNVAFEESDFSEAKYARLISDRFNTDHTEILLSPDQLLQNIPNIMGDLDHPSGDGFNTWLVSKVTKEAGIKMALSGLGGDELFGGYPIFKRFKSLLTKKWILSFPTGLRKLVGDGLLTFKPGISSEKIARVLVQDYFDLENIYQFDRQVLLDRQIHQLFEKTELPPKSVYEMVHKGVGYKTDGYALPPLSRVTWAELNTYMLNVLLRDSDQMSMAHALEVRVPFLDHQLVEMVLGLRDDVKFPHTPKQLLVDSFSGMLPEEITNRPKMGFLFPWEIWLKSDLQPFALSGLETMKSQPGFKPEGIDQLWNDFLNQRPNVTWSRVWPLIVLGNWIKENEIG